MKIILNAVLLFAGISGVAMGVDFSLPRYDHWYCHGKCSNGEEVVGVGLSRADALSGAVLNRQLRQCATVGNIRCETSAFTAGDSELHGNCLGETPSPICRVWVDRVGLSIQSGSYYYHRTFMGSGNSYRLAEEDAHNKCQGYSLPQEQDVDRRFMCVTNEYHVQ